MSSEGRANDAVRLSLSGRRGGAPSSLTLGTLLFSR
jgi:hypothetical protein